MGSPEHIGYLMRNYISSLPSVDVTTLSDEDLVRGINASCDQRMVDEFFRRYRKVIAKAVDYASGNSVYGLAMDEDAKSDALSEAYIATMNALRLYDFKSSSLKTFITNKVLYRFKDLKRSGEIHVSRERPLSYYAGEDVEDDSYCGSTDYVEYSAAQERYNADRYNDEIGDACSRLFESVNDSRQRECLRMLLAAFYEGVKKPVEHVAEQIGRSRQWVYNVIKQVRENTPVNIASEICECL